MPALPHLSPTLLRRGLTAVVVIAVLAAGGYVVMRTIDPSTASDPDRDLLAELGFDEVRIVAAIDQPETLRAHTTELGTTGGAVATWQRDRDRDDPAVTGHWETAVTADGHVVWRFHDLTVTTNDAALRPGLTAVTAAVGPVTLTANPDATIDGAWQLCDRNGNCLSADARAGAEAAELDEPLIAGVSVNSWEIVAGRVSPWQPGLTAGLLDPGADGLRRLFTAAWPLEDGTELRCLIAARQDPDGKMQRTGDSPDAAVLCTTADGRPVAAGPLVDLGTGDRPGAGTRLEGLTAVADVGPDS